MYNCYTHGWSSLYEMCPRCSPIETYTSNGTIDDNSLKVLIGFGMNRIYYVTPLDLRKKDKMSYSDQEEITPNTQLRFNKQKDAFTEIIKLVSLWEDSGAYPYRPCEEIIEVWERISGEYFEGI